MFKIQNRWVSVAVLDKRINFHWLAAEYVGVSEGQRVTGAQMQQLFKAQSAVECMGTLFIRLNEHRLARRLQK